MADILLPNAAKPIPDEALRLLDAIPAAIKREFVPWPGSDELIVTFAPAGAFSLRLIPFRRNLLCLADHGSSYYTVHAHVTAQAIIDFAAAAGLRKVLCLGTSKGGYGALLIAGLCAQRERRRHWHALAFSPPTAVYPRNDALAYVPSYRALLARAEGHAGLRRNLERYGDVRFIEWMRNLYAVISYAEGFPSDRSEAERLSAPNIRKYPVPYPRHGVIGAFTLQGEPLDNIKRRLAALSKGGRRDADLAAITEDAEAENNAQWLFWNRWTPSVTELVDEVLAVDIMKPQRREP